MADSERARIAYNLTLFSPLPLSFDDFLLFAIGMTMMGDRVSTRINLSIR